MPRVLVSQTQRWTFTQFQDSNCEFLLPIIPQFPERNCVTKATARVARGLQSAGGGGVGGDRKVHMQRSGSQAAHANESPGCPHTGH